MVLNRFKSVEIRETSFWETIPQRSGLCEEADWIRRECALHGVSLLLRFALAGPENVVRPITFRGRIDRADRCLPHHAYWRVFEGWRINRHQQALGYAFRLYKCWNLGSGQPKYDNSILFSCFHFNGTGMIDQERKSVISGQRGIHISHLHPIFTSKLPYLLFRGVLVTNWLYYRNIPFSLTSQPVLWESVSNHNFTISAETIYEFTPTKVPTDLEVYWRRAYKYKTKQTWFVFKKWIPEVRLGAFILDSQRCKR